MEGWDEIWMARDARMAAGIDGFVLNQGEASSRRRRSADASGRLPAASVGRALAGATPLRGPRDGGIGHRGWAKDGQVPCVLCWSLNYPADTYVIARSPSPHASHKPGAHGRSRSPGAQLHVLWAAIIRRRRGDALAVGSKGRHRRIALANCCVSKTGYVRALFRHRDCLCDNHHVAIPPTTYGSIALPRVSSSA